MKGTRSGILLSILSATLLLLSLTICQAALTPNTNLFSNPGFESGGTSWPTSSYWTVVTDTFYSGKESMRLINNSTSTYPVITRSVPVQTGVQYTFSSWVKTQNVAGTDCGATIAMEYYDASGNYVPGGCYPTGIKGTCNWTKISATTDRIPSNVAKITFLLYLRKGCTGTAWFDDTDVEVLDNYMFRPMILHPHYRNTILPGQTQRLTLGVQAAGSATHPTNTLNISVTVKDPSGRTASCSVPPATDPTSWQSLSMNLPSTTAGTYSVTANLVDNVSQAVLVSKPLSFVLDAPTVAMPKVYLDNLNRCVVNGQTFFPLGFYCWGNQSDAATYLSMMAGTRFNCLMNYTTPWYPLSDIKSFLDNANSKNIKVIFSVKDCYEGSQWALTQAGSWNGSFQVLQGMVNTFKSHPALLAWYLNDELPASYLSAITDRYNYIVANDYNHPVWQVLYEGENLPSYVDNTDVLGQDNYPLLTQLQAKSSTLHLETFGQASSDAVSATMASRGVWMVPECCSINASTTPNSQPPTYAEIMCEAYQALTAGARGLIFYDLTELVANDGSAQWTIMKSVGEDLHSIEPIVLGNDVSLSSQILSADSRVDTITRSVNGTIYALAVNPYNVSVTDAFKLGSATTARHIVVGLPGKPLRTLTVSNRTFSETIEPHGIRVYQLAN